MLVLSVNTLDQVVIVTPDGQVGYLTMLQDKGGNRKLAFEFPESIRIYRGKVWDAMTATGTPPPITEPDS